MLLRYLSPLILFFILFGCKPKDIEPPKEKLHKVSVLSLFKPKSAEITFSENVYAKTDDGNYITIIKNDIAVIEFINTNIVLKDRQPILLHYRP